ncbi:MAG TPA: penicillin acylase family protein [Chloroflexota bacterium]|nr:penicillin acylase family protein [Chloroflexota bacterium]
MAYPHQRPYLEQKVPPKDARLTAAVGNTVTIRWDRWGIAHIRATRRWDLFFGLGYATAQECLWRLDYCRRQARGELAAILGRDALPADRAMRLLGLGRHADTLAGTLHHAVAEALASLTAGINHWIAQAAESRRLPVEFDWLGYEPSPWNVADSIALWKHRWWTLTGRLENITLGEAARRTLAPELLAPFMAVELGEETIIPAAHPTPGRSQAAPPVPGGTDSGEGSNNWAVSGRRTTTGFPVLCSDPHNPFGQPGQWFQAQLTLEDGSLDVAGAILAGSPGVYFGRNRHLAWGFTNHVASTRDLYVETTDPARPGQYREAGQWRPFEVERLTIPVRGEAPEVCEVWRTVRGPVVNAPTIRLVQALQPAEAPLSLRWTGLEVGSGLEAVLGLNAAGSVQAGLDALADWVCPVANALLADDQGHIAYHVIGRIPRRSAAVRAYRLAEDPWHAWEGFIPFEALPQRIDPPEGWLATANQPPWAADPPGLPYLGSAAWADGGRMARIRHRLTAAPRLSPQEIGAVQADIISTRAAILVPALQASLSDSQEPSVREALQLLQGWDGSFAEDTAAPTVWTAIWEHWLRRVAAARFPAELVALTQGQAGAVAHNLIRGRDTSPPWFGHPRIAEELAGAVAEAMAWLRRRVGATPESWRWGAVHTVTWRHPLSLHGPEEQRAAASAVLDVGPYRTSGGAGTVRAASHSSQRPFQVVGGSTYRLVADLAPGGGLRATTTTGQSGHPGSPHYADQAPLWLQDAYHPFPLDDFEPQAITTIEPRSK